MTEPEEKDADRFAPQHLLAEFTRNRIVRCLAVALAVHVVIIGGSSLDYVYFSWINPEAGRAREDARKKAREAEVAKTRAAQTQPSETGEKAEPGKTATGEGASGQETDQDLIEKNKTNPVIREITETAKPEDIPDKPDDLGISIGETSEY